MDDATRRVCRDVGENVYGLRRQRGWTQREVAERMDVEESAVRRIESGRYNLTIGTVALVARALGVAPHELLQPAPRTPKRRPGRPTA